MEHEKAQHGGKRKGAGRPTTERPTLPPISWRPKSEAVATLWRELGGSRWLNEFLEGLVKKR